MIGNDVRDAMLRKWATSSGSARQGVGRGGQHDRLIAQLRRQTSQRHDLVDLHRVGAGIERQAAANLVGDELEHAPSLREGLSVVFAGRSSRHDCMHSAGDHKLDMLFQHIIVDGIVGIERRGDDVDDSFEPGIFIRVSSTRVPFILLVQAR